MKKYEVLYDWPITELTRLTASGDADAYAATLAEPRITVFTSLAERLGIVIQILSTAKAERNVTTIWSKLIDLTSEFSTQFGDFPDYRPRVMKLALLLRLKASLAVPAPMLGSPPLDETEVVADSFHLQTTQGSFLGSWFAWENIQSLPDSTVYFSWADADALQKQLLAGVQSPDFLFHLTATLDGHGAELGDRMVFIKRVAQPIPDPTVTAFVQLAMLLSGRAVHEPRKSNRTAPQVISPYAIRAGVEYQQLNDVLYVLSEYNSRSELLTKYLTLYHVFENFMFKLPIVTLERAAGGRMFSIRDFKRLYREVNMAELGALKRLFAEVFDVAPTPGRTFRAEVDARWATFVPAPDISKVDRVLEKLGVRRGDNPLRHADFSGPSSDSYFAQIVYAMRNVIVHNTETEWHLSYATLDEPTCALLERFLMPSLEEICFFLIGGPNNHVWYQNRTLALYS